MRDILLICGMVGIVALACYMLRDFARVPPSDSSLTHGKKLVAVGVLIIICICALMSFNVVWMAFEGTWQSALRGNIRAWVALAFAMFVCLLAIAYASVGVYHIRRRI